MPRRPAQPSRRSPPDPTKARALRAYESGDLRSALALATQALRSRPRDAELLHLQGGALAKLGDPSAALSKLLLADKASPMDPGILLSVAQTQRTLQRFDDMNTTIERVLYLAPRLPQALSLKAQSLREQGRTDEAMRVLAPALERDARDPILLMAHAELCAATKDADAGIESCERALALGELRPSVRRFALFTLGRLLDQAERYDDAFEAYRKGNAMLEPGRVTRAAPVTELWTAELLSSIAPAPVADETPLLIVGMPRSGTTLIEQILASHPRVETAGESHTLPDLARAITPDQLNSAVITSLGKRYLHALSSVATSETARMLDKMPGNYLHLGLLCRACPGARVIHAQRDPRDICLSCFFQNFGHSHSYSRDLALCAQQYVEHTRIMDHWRSVLELPIEPLSYAELVSDPEPVVRRLLDFAGLGFDDACLRHHESGRTVTTRSSDQVREPVYRSSLARWKRYEHHIDPMLEVFRAAGIELPDT